MSPISLICALVVLAVLSRRLRTLPPITTVAIKQCYHSGYNPRQAPLPGQKKHRLSRCLRGLRTSVHFRISEFDGDSGTFYFPDEFIISPSADKQRSAAGNGFNVL